MLLFATVKLSIKSFYDNFFYLWDRSSAFFRIWLDSNYLINFFKQFFISDFVTNCKLRAFIRSKLNCGKQKNGLLSYFRAKLSHQRITNFISIIAFSRKLNIMWILNWILLIVLNLKGILAYFPVQFSLNFLCLYRNLNGISYLSFSMEIFEYR